MLQGCTCYGPFAVGPGVWAFITTVLPLGLLESHTSKNLHKPHASQGPSRVQVSTPHGCCSSLILSPSKITCRHYCAIWSNVTAHWAQLVLAWSIKFINPSPDHLGRPK